MITEPETLYIDNIYLGWKLNTFDVNQNFAQHKRKSQVVDTIVKKPLKQCNLCIIAKVTNLAFE